MRLSVVQRRLEDSLERSRGKRSEAEARVMFYGATILRAVPQSFSAGSNSI